MLYRLIKRFFDIIFSLIALIAFSPLLLILAVLIKATSSGQVIFKQRRVKMDKRHFYIYKFRTMSASTPKDMPTHLLENPEIYITKIGRFLRKTSLDELPQILNIFLGHMSFVGPRPALWNQFDLIEERDKYGANDVPAGLTGWAQVNGRDDISVKEKARLDGEYTAKMGFLFDCKCFFLTIKKVFTRSGVTEGALQNLDEAKEKETVNK